MEAPDQSPNVTRNHTRRQVIRKAAYSAPVVFAIAAAPNVALGASGGGGKPVVSNPPKGGGKGGGK
jgi:hypothetical protein